MANKHGKLNESDLQIKLQGPGGEPVKDFQGRITSELGFNDLNLCAPLNPPQSPC